MERVPNHINACTLGNNTINMQNELANVQTWWNFKVDIVDQLPANTFLTKETQVNK